MMYSVQKKWNAAALVSVQAFSMRRFRDCDKITAHFCSTSDGLATITHSPDGVGCSQLTGRRLVQLPADSRLPLLLLLWCAADVVDDENAEDDEVMKSSSIECPGGEQVLHGGGCRKVMKAERKLWLVISDRIKLFNYNHILNDH